MKRPVLVSFFVLFIQLAASGQSPDWEAPLREKLETMAATLSATLKPWPVPDRVFPVVDHGAVGDGKTLNTAAIQKAIDACSAAGGGVVRIDKGEYVTGTIELKSGVMLEVAKDAKLLGSLNIGDYTPHTPRHRTVMDSWYKLTQSLIYAEGCERIGIRGEGVIDGRGSRENFPGKNDIGAMPGRPFLIRMIECRQVVMDGITLRDAASWMQNYLNCDDLILQGVRVENLANWNNDAFDIDGCRNVIVRRCSSTSVDDGLCFKGAGLRDMENVLVEDSEFFTPCNAIKFGTDSQGGFRNVLIRNVKIGGTSRANLHKTQYAISGISLLPVDGGIVENILVSKVRMDQTASPFCLRLGDRGRVLPEMPKPAPGALRRVILEDVSGDGHERRGSIVSGIPNAKIQDIIFRRIHLTASGGGTKQDAERDVPELIDVYPDAFSFGKTVPAYGFWIRHADRILFDDVRIQTATSDARPPFVKGIDTADVSINGKR
ncbi:MAG TPA: glycosyl hydrolase family 28 protein [Luteolibacter sp.]